MNIVVLGSGGWGTALAMLLEQNRHTVTLWSHDPKKAELLDKTRENPLLKGVRIPERIAVTSDLAVLQNAEMAVFASPSFALRSVAHEAAPHLKKGTLLVSLTKGIERVSKILMPLLFFMMLAIIIRGLMLPGAWAGVEFLFKFDPQAFTFSALLQAMGFTFFSLCVGCGCMMTYGSYLDDKTNVLRSCSWIAFLSVIASIMGGLMIMPSVFAFGLDPTAGPGLTFITMPAVFAQMPMGQLFAVMFYLCLAVAAITSSVSMIEILVSYLVDEQKMSRPKAAVLSTIALAVVGILPCLSFGLLSDVKMFNGRTFFDVFDFFTSNLSLPLGGLVILYLAGYTCWDRVKNTAPEKWQWLLKLMLRVFSPILVLVVLISGLI